jgi:hypothetical protein
MIFCISKLRPDNITRREKRSMSYTPEQIKRASSPAIQGSIAEQVLRMPDKIPENDDMPGIVITGNIRLRVTASYAALRPVTGYYRIETKGMQEEPLHVIWMVEGNVLNHTANSIDVAFDMKGIRAGETLTRMLSAQVTDCNGHGRIFHCSVFVQIFVVKDDLIVKYPSPKGRWACP